MKLKHTHKQIVLAVLLAAVVCILLFIWGNSMLSGKVSALISHAVRMLFGGRLTEHAVRKAGHFTEFLLLGAGLGLFFTLKGTARRDKAMYLTLFALFVPLMDETIQLFSQNRGPQVTDIWIDIAGYVCGCLPALAIAALINWVRRKRERRQNNQ